MLMWFPQIFNDEVDAYKPWALFLIFVSILILISGVVLLTHKKPERVAPASNTRMGSVARKSKHKAKASDAKGLANSQEEDDDVGEGHSLRRSEEGRPGNEDETWAVGEVSDDEDEPDSATRLQRTPTTAGGDEGVGLMLEDHVEEDTHNAGHGTGRPRAASNLSRRASDPFRDSADEFGEFAGGRAR